MMDNVNVVEWLLNIFNWIFEQFSYSADFVCNLLPDSPFQLLDYTPIAGILPYINYFIPLDFMMSVLAAWSSCIIIYYGYSLVLRWLKAIV